MSGAEALELKDLRDVDIVLDRAIAAVDGKDVGAAVVELNQLSGLVAGRIMTGSQFDAHTAPKRIRELLEKTPPGYSPALRELKTFKTAVESALAHLEDKISDEH